MNPLWGHVAGAITVILMLTFIGIWIWAWRPRHKQAFERMAQIPMHEDAACAADDEAGQSGTDARQAGAS